MSRRKRMRKSTLILLAFVVYTLGAYAYFLPRTDMNTGQIAFTICMNIVVLAALWYLYRRKENMGGNRRQGQTEKTECGHGATGLRDGQRK